MFLKNPQFWSESHLEESFITNSFIFFNTRCPVTVVLLFYNRIKHFGLTISDLFSSSRSETRLYEFYFLNMAAIMLRTVSLVSYFQFLSTKPIMELVMRKSLAGS